MLKPFESIAARLWDGRRDAYASKKCAAYRPAPTREVPGRKGMSYTEEDWVDEDVASHRGLDD